MRQFALIVFVALAGCADPSIVDSEPRPGIAPQEGFDEDTRNGLHLEGRMLPCEAGHCIEATASNEGSEPVHVSNICTQPFHDRMERDGKMVQHKEPMATCAAFGTRPMEPGEQIDFGFEWDGTVWGDERQQSVAAPQGAYQWSAHFQAWTEEGGGDTIELAIEFAVVVGPT